MAIYKVKHKARGRYGVLTPENNWVVDFLGDKEQAQSKANELNQLAQAEQDATVVKANSTLHSNKVRKYHFRLTEKGWISTGE